MAVFVIITMLFISIFLCQDMLKAYVISTTKWIRFLV